jgi:uncharacterized protein YecE (DUF72 family)
VKAHALMTGQPTEVARLPEPLIDALPAALAGRSRIYAKDLPRELLDAVWESFLDALEPLRDAGKLGGILLQYPRWFLPTPENKKQLAPPRGDWPEFPARWSCGTVTGSMGRRARDEEPTGRSRWCATSASPT